jgi:hypothetical protein
MLREDYLRDSNVDGFVTWFSHQLGAPTPTHNYVTAAGVSYKFDGISSALKQYNWPFKFTLPAPSILSTGCTYHNNEDALGNLRAGLESAINIPGNPGEDAAARAWAVAVMYWGGVRHGNERWLNTHKVGLAAELRRVRDLLSRGDDDVRLLKAGIARFNAGMTKVYSLLLPSFIIYDSRVAGALSWFVAKWCETSASLPGVPELLCFPCMRPKEAEDAPTRKVRNPTCGSYRFPWLNSASTPALHARWNLRSSWILHAALTKAEEMAQPRLPNRAHTTTPFHAEASPLRALEASLFMWGYDLSHSAPCLDGYASAAADSSESDDEETALPDICNEPETAAVTALPRADARVQQATTRGAKAKEFQWWFDDAIDALVIVRTGMRDHEYFACGEIFRIVYELFDVFGYDWFPLANDVAKLTSRRERPGLGIAILKDHFPAGQKPSPQSIAHAQSASQLGVILQYLGLFEGDNAIRGIHWRLKAELPENIDELRMLLNSP